MTLRGRFRICQLAVVPARQEDRLLWGRDERQSVGIGRFGHRGYRLWRFCECHVHANHGRAFDSAALSVEGKQ